MKQLVLYNEKLYNLAGENWDDDVVYIVDDNKVDILFVPKSKVTIFTPEVSDIMRISSETR